MVVRSGSPTKNSQNGTNTKFRFCLQKQRKTTNNACRAELGRYPLIINIQKKKFYNHLKGSDSQTFHYKAITYREMNLEKSHLSKLVLGLCSQTQTHPTEPQESNTIRHKHTPQSPRRAIRSNQIMRKQKDNYMTHWKKITKN
jgi:hypothetical protein